MKASIPSVQAVDVYGFENGSIVALYNIIMDSTAPAVNVSAMVAAVATASGNITSLPIDTSFVPVVEG